VLPRPLDPIAVEVDVPEPEELNPEEDAVGVLPPGVLPPKRLVAALNAAEAFGADVERDGVEAEELELEEGDAAALVELVVGDVPRPRSSRLPRKRGVISDA
jgi:hypothetical protein